MQYGVYEVKKNIISLIKTKIFHYPARLIRYPVYLRNKKNIIFSKGFTCGYNCRIESIKDKEVCGCIKFGINVKIGDYVHISSAELVEIKSNVLIASHVFISDLDHGKYKGEFQSSPLSIPSERKIYSKPVCIEENVWIGENVTILKGVTIGKGSIIAANTLVNKNVPENCIFAGNPGRVIKVYKEDNQKWECPRK